MASKLSRPAAHKLTGANGVVGISTTAMDRAHPRSSTSEALLDVALDHAREQGGEARRIRLDEQNG